ncbi:MAG: sugar transferase [Bacilli bacterium]|nr:sugar transferase [Bacilli bacterium]
MYKKFFKRIIDIIISIMALLLLWPVFLIIAILIKIEDNGPVFFKQVRTGQYGNNFKMLKFRTMSIAKKKNKRIEKNQKVTKIGKILRNTSLDELPQFINVLKGDMSLIGPRPWIVEYFERFTEEQKRRLNVKPGITGLAQSKGRNGLTIFQKIQYDLEYVDNISFILDLKIIIESIKIVLKTEYAEINQEDINKELKQLELQK